MRNYRSALLLPLSMTALLFASSCATTSEQDAGGTTTATATTATAPDAGTSTSTTGSADAGTGTTDMSSMPKSARTMLTSAEVSGIVGRSVVLQTGSDTTAAMSTTTASYVAAGAGTATASPIVTIRLAGDGQLADSRDMARNGGHKVADVPSLGRAAFYDDSDGSLYVNDKGQTLIVTVPAQVTGKTRQQVATQLGRIASGRM